MLRPSLKYVKVHHLDCGPMKNLLGSMPAHCLLVELPDRLVLVDSGFGLADGATPARLGPSRFLLGASHDPKFSAVRQVEKLGFQATDVRDVVLTHLDVDHVGGISDFPQAVVHCTADEHGAATQPHAREKLRYRAVQWAHGPQWSLASPGPLEWKGFTGCTPLFGGGDVVLVPMPGHSRGHAAVAVRSGQDAWLLHAGDAFFHRGSVERTPVPRLVRTFEATVGVNLTQVRENHQRLAALASSDPSVTVFCAHDPVQLAALTSP